MSEAIILEVIRELESFLIELPRTDDFIDYDPRTLEALKEVIKELRMMSDFFRDNKSEEMSRLKYLLADFAETAQVTAEHKSWLGPYVISENLYALRMIKKRLMEFGVGKAVSSSQSGGEEGDEGVVVGVEKDVQQLVFKVILSEEEWLIHMPILIKGMVGMGKTTLARQAYNHAAVIEKFKGCRAWVSLSSFTSKHEVLVELIRQLVTLDGDSLWLEEMDNQSLQQMLFQQLKEMPPWFIVLDNVLPEMLFESFLLDLAHLSKPRRRCRLLITSCHQIDELFYTHEMKALDSDKSWQLFLKIVDKFTSNENKFSKELEWKGREMLKNCGGLPVAIIDVGREKAKQRLLGIEWEELFDSIDLSKTLKLLEPMYNSLDEQPKSQSPTKIRRNNRKSLPISMSEAIILGVIGEMESFRIRSLWMEPERDPLKVVIKEVIKELGMMLDYFRDNNSEEISRLKNLQADFVEMAQVSAKHMWLESPYAISKDLRALRKIKKRMMEFGVGKPTVSSSQSAGEEGVGMPSVGLEKDVQQLVFKVILSEEMWLTRKPILIKGMVGIGKTTLARQVYKHAAVIEKFKRFRAWVSLSSFTSKHEVLVELIRQLVILDGDSLLLEEMDNQSLEQMLRRHLKEMPPWFIVLDNVLPEMLFKSFLLELTRQSEPRHRCVLLITSSHQINQEEVYTHEMEALDYDKSWQLFLKTVDKITSVENKFTKELERKGKEMLKKCGGLPIAIIDVGREKAKQRLLGIEWEELFDSIDLTKTLEKLEPMYLELNENMKSCFLHMSFFKENAIMREEKLHHVWVANGVRTGTTPCASLADQSIIEVVHPYPETYRMKRCRMNPLLHMLSIKKAEEEIGLEILRNNRNNRPSESPRHRVIHCGRAKFNHSTNQDKNLISLIFHGGGQYLDDTGQYYWKSFELLKILDMEDFGAKTLSESIGTLTGLRYLGLRNNYVEEIPHSLGGLKRLEVLDIALNFMVEVPDIIKDMSSLRHLYMSDVICRKPLEVDALQNLETLTFMSIYSWTYEASNLEKMTSLHKLGIEEIDENSDVSELFPSLAKLEELNHLILRGFRFRMMSCLDEIRVLHRHEEICSLRLDGCIARLPSADSFPREIEYLALVNTCLDEDPMPVLMELPYLRRLKLRNAYNGRELVFNMRQLQILSISELWNLREVRFEGYEIDYLEQLEIMNCPHLETLPQEIQSMRRLQKFKMVTTKHIATKIKDSDLLSKIVEVDISP